MLQENILCGLRIVQWYSKICRLPQRLCVNVRTVKCVEMYNGDRLTLIKEHCAHDLLSVSNPNRKRSQS